MNRKVYRVILPILILVELGFIFLSCMSYSNKDINKIKEVSKIDREKFTMYIEQDDGTYKEETDTNYWPSIGYRLNEEKTYCVDHYGEDIEPVITFTNGSMTITSNKTVFCTLYFKKKGDDITVTVSTAGTTGVVPTSGGYKASLTCDTADSLFNEKYQRVEIGAATTDEVKCNLDYTVADTSSYTTLILEVESKATAVTSTNSAGTSETSYRYTGKTPDNYVWFNNEMWRIIGSIPTCTSSGCGTSENLVKIIREDSIGGLVYDVSNVGSWGSNTLYSLLNAHYYATSKENLNGQSHSGCYGYYDETIANCNYSNKGILSTSYYGKMVKNVYWNTGASEYNVTAETAYTSETANQTVLGYIGLMNASDYGYATDSSYYSTTLDGYDTSEITGTNWLYNQGYEWTCTYYSGSNSLAIYYDGALNSRYPLYGGSTRPVVYLNSSVYIKDGTGTITDPYIIGM